MQAITSDSHAPIKLWADSVDDNALEQLRRTASMPFIHHHLAVMPDVHWGMGATVGSVVATLSAVIPAAVGVDIGCGMCAVRTSLRAEHLPDSLAGVRASIEGAVPVGFSMHGSAQDLGELDQQWLDIARAHPGIRMHDDRRRCQLGTLGGGNHFIEICLDESGDVWVMLHSGSRNSGKVIADYFITRAKEECERWHTPLPDIDLAFLPEGSALFDDYVHAVEWAQDYASENRKALLRLVLSAMREHLPEFALTGKAVNCHHNYISRENHYGKNVIVTRKGAVRARVGDWGIIPGSMGARSFIVRGKGCAESFHSCSHGAGRRMGRKEAARQFTAQDLAEQTMGVECRKDDAVVDEIPAAYKDIDEVMAQQSDLVDIAHTLKQVLCVKG